MFEKISIKNFKSFKDTSFSIRPLTLLAGLNSSGKSSIIQSIRYKAIEANSLSSFEGHGGLEELQCRYAEKGESISIALTPYTNESAECISNAIYISADRLGPQVLFNLPSGISAASIGSCGENVVAYCRELLGKIIHDSRIHPKSSGDTFEYLLESWMSEVSPGVKFNFWHDRRFDAAALQIGARNDQTIWERPTNVGFGLSYTLPVVAALLGANENDLVLIENPEAHLHPAGQTKMGELIARAAQAGAQIFIETHSDHLIDGVRIAVRDMVLPFEDAIVLFCSKSLETNLSSVDEIKFLENGDLSHWPSGFCDQSIKNLSKLAMF